MNKPTQVFLVTNNVKLKFWFRLKLLFNPNLRVISKVQRDPPHQVLSATYQVIGKPRDKSATST